MTSVVQLFERKAELFSKGDFQAASETLKTPSAVFYGDKVFPLQNADSVCRLLYRYRSRLARLGYDHSEFEILSTQEPDPQSAVVRVRWRNIGRDGEELSALLCKYFCAKRQDETWYVALVEINENDFPQADGISAITPVVQ